jgi:hypothetical protein
MYSAIVTWCIAIDTIRQSSVRMSWLVDITYSSKSRYPKSVIHGLQMASNGFYQRIAAGFSKTFSIIHSSYRFQECYW